MANYFNKTFYHFSILLLASIASASGEQFTILESGKVRYEEKKIILDSPVLFETDFAKVSAKQAIIHLSSQEAAKGTQTIEIEGDVLLSVEPGITATCERATLATDGHAILRDHVIIKSKEYGSLTTDGRVTLQSGISKESVLEYISCSGNIEYLSENDEKNHELKLVCSGEVYIDGSKKEMRFKKGVGMPQVFLQEHLCKIYADEAVIFYDLVDSRFSVRKIAFNGAVEMMNREGILLQCAIADHVDLDCKKEEMHFIGSGKKRVLFYDKINNLQISAPEMKIMREAKTKKEKFQGLGDVRFHFAEKEFEQLIKRFQLEKNQLQ